MAESGKKISQLNNLMSVMPQVLVNAKVSNTKKSIHVKYSDTI